MGLIIDNFASGGGASEGIEQAIGRPVVVVKDYPVWAKTFCEVYKNYLQPILKEELVSNPNRQYANSELKVAYKKPKCYRPNDNPYPLCKGAVKENLRLKYQCIECCIYEDYPDSQGY